MLECFSMSQDGLWQSCRRFNPLTTPWMLNLKTDGKTERRITERAASCVCKLIKSRCAWIIWKCFPQTQSLLLTVPTHYFYHSDILPKYKVTYTTVSKLSLFALDPLLSSFSLEFPLHRDVCDCDDQSWFYSDRRFWGSLGFSLKWATTIHPGNGSSRPAQAQRRTHKHTQLCFQSWWALSFWLLLFYAELKIFSHKIWNSHIVIYKITIIIVRYEVAIAIQFKYTLFQVCIPIVLHQFAVMIKKNHLWEVHFEVEIHNYKKESAISNFEITTVKDKVTLWNMSTR